MLIEDNAAGGNERKHHDNAGCKAFEE